MYLCVSVSTYTTSYLLAYMYVCVSVWI